MIRSALLAVLAALAACREQPPAPPEARPPLALLTSLPIAFPEQFTLDAPAHPLLQRLERDYQVQPVDGPGQLRPGGLLLAVQPQALTAERLVALDEWVRGGGRLVLLADPAFTWESSRPLGDLARPPYAYPDTGLLGHWGLRLDAPAEDGPAVRRIGGSEVLTASPGTLVKTGGTCSVQDGGFIASCRLGKGQALVIADADFVQAGTPGGVDGPSAANHDALAAAIASLR